jgi:hypothetical protein
VGHETFENHTLFTTIKDVFDKRTAAEIVLIGAEKSFTAAESSKSEHKDAGSEAL